jgi:hypothetical protein
MINKTMESCKWWIEIKIQQLKQEVWWFTKSRLNE